MLDWWTGRRTPLALRNLVAQPRRLAASLAGVVFAVALMFMQRGFQRSLLDGTVEIVRQFDAEIVIVGKARYSLVVRERFPRARLNLAASVPGVEKARPLFIENNIGVWKNVETGVLRPIRTIAIDPSDCPLKLPEIQAQAKLLTRTGAVLADVRSKKTFGPLTPGVVGELSSRRVEVVGSFEMGTDFANSGNLVTSESNFAHFFPEPPGGGGRQPSRVDLGLVGLSQGQDVEDVLQRLRAQLPEDVRALTLREFIDREREFWRRSTPIGYIFGFGTIMGVIVGIVISYQILYSDIVEHLKEFATLKALGYRNGSLARVVTEQSMVIAGLAYGPAWLLSAGMYRAIGGATGLPLRMNWTDSLAIFGLAATMCVVAGALATRRLFSTDPAELF